MARNKGNSLMADIAEVQTAAALLEHMDTERMRSAIRAADRAVSDMLERINAMRDAADLSRPFER